MSASITGLSERAKVWQVNAFFNQKIRYEEDIVLWGQDDYWATPLETLSQGRGDCEDYAIAKYFTLLELGIPSARMRLVYVFLVTRGRDINDSRRHSHMVVAYFPRPASEPWILDNLNDDILPADQRTDLSPIFSFGIDGLWIGTGNQASRATFSRWQNAIARIRQEGFVHPPAATGQLAGLAPPPD